jgi:hypothetical protein
VQKLTATLNEMQALFDEAKQSKRNLKSIILKIRILLDHFNVQQEMEEKDAEHASVLAQKGDDIK